MNVREDRPSAEILQFPVEARRSAVELSRRFSQHRLPDFVEFAAGGASYHDDAIRKEAENRDLGH